MGLLGQSEWPQSPHLNQETFCLEARLALHQTPPSPPRGMQTNAEAAGSGAARFQFAGQTFQGPSDALPAQPEIEDGG